MLANVNLQKDLERVARYGRIVIIGNRGEVTINARLAMMKELDVRGIALWNVEAGLLRQIMADVLVGVADGSLKPVIGKSMSLSEAAAAHVAVLEPGAKGKLILVP